MPPLLSLDAVSAAYGQSRVLWDIDLATEAGTAVALLGRNGVGKTTLLRTIIGLHRVATGKVFFEGKDVTRLSAHERAWRGIGFVPQGRNIFPHLTVEENLKIGLAALAGRAGNGDTDVPDYVFDLFPTLARLRNRKGGVLSGGEQQQLAIGRALAGRPRLLLLDEPTEGIQPSIVRQIEKVLDQVRRELKISILIVEQYLDFAWAFADRYYVMQRGRFVRDGWTQEHDPAAVAELLNI